MSLTAAARQAIETHTALTAAYDVRRARALDRNADYRGASVEYVRRRRDHADAMDALKVALSADDIRRAAEAGSPAARMLEANAR